MMKLADALKKLSLVAALLAVMNSPASAELYGHWPLNDGEGDVARNLGPGEDGDIFEMQWDSSINITLKLSAILLFTFY